MHFQVTVRYGGSRKRYHIFTVEAPGVARALELAAADLPEEVALEGDLVEIRPSTAPEDRRYLGEEEG
jgi:hypothetical protein